MVRTIHYSWKTDRQTGEVLSQLADRHNHVIDALRYALEGARKARSSSFCFQSAGRRVMAGPLDGYIPGGRAYHSSSANRTSVPGPLRHMWENY